MTYFFTLVIALGYVGTSAMVNANPGDQDSLHTDIINPSLHGIDRMDKRGQRENCCVK